MYNKKEVIKLANYYKKDSIVRFALENLTMVSPMLPTKAVSYLMAIGMEDPMVLDIELNWLKNRISEVVDIGCYIKPDTNSSRNPIKPSSTVENNYNEEEPIISDFNYGSEYTTKKLLAVV